MREWGSKGMGKWGSNYKHILSKLILYEKLEVVEKLNPKSPLIRPSIEAR